MAIGDQVDPQVRVDYDLVFECRAFRDRRGSGLGEAAGGPAVAPGRAGLGGFVCFSFALGYRTAAGDSALGELDGIRSDIRPVHFLPMAL